MGGPMGRGREQGQEGDACLLRLGGYGIWDGCHTAIRNGLDRGLVGIMQEDPKQGLERN